MPAFFIDWKTLILTITKLIELIELRCIFISVYDRLFLKSNKSQLTVDFDFSWFFCLSLKTACKVVRPLRQALELVSARFGS